MSAKRREKRSPDQVLGKFLAKKDGEFYQDGDYHFDAREIINTLSANGFKIVRRATRRPRRAK